ncbi:hypothetical protein BZA77DRAFT_23930 [Pyronema omphalodes]|nr:hypothetical protein BZA77DRAFT_23930 [Pyronema omphalodes]
MATAPGAPAICNPGKSLGFIALGSSLHHILGRLRTLNKVFTSISTIYEPNNPLGAPVIILLSNNGIRLRFDGADQRLRLIEILDFQLCPLLYNSRDMVKTGPGCSGGPTFKSIYNKIFGPTYPGEYIPSSSLYVLSYPGVAFSFPVKNWRDDIPFDQQLSAPDASPAISMAIFNGTSWAEARDGLFTRPVGAPRIPHINGPNARQSPANDEVESIKIHDSTLIEVLRRHNPSFWITLGSTTPQDLIMELGPPDVIYRKSDHRLSIHRAGDGDEATGSSDPHSSSDDDHDASGSAGAALGQGDCFYNYFSLGFDVFLSAAKSASHPVATKIIIHGNVPGSYLFQRYRRCRWIIQYPGMEEIHSEMEFGEALERLRKRFGGGQKPMPLSRGNDSPSSSCELLGGWEEGDMPVLKQIAGGVEMRDFGNTELYGFPGFIFEVLKNKSISCLTVF